MPTDQTATASAGAPDKARDANQDANAQAKAQGAKRPLPPAAERALAEAAARRAVAERTKTEAPTEIAGRGGLDPARYGDWEIKGLISDF